MCESGRRDNDRAVCVLIRKGTAQRNYAGAPGGSHLKDTWPACNLLEVVPCSHTRLDCRVVVPASPVFRKKGYSIKTDLNVCLCVSSDKDSEKTFDRFQQSAYDLDR